MEEDLACTNVSLDLIGWAESMYTEAAKLSQDKVSADDLDYRREQNEYFNTLLTEQPNSDFAVIMVRQFFMDTYNYYLCTELMTSTDDFLKAVATKSIKEVTYHLRRSSEWMIRFGKGTETSRLKAQNAINQLWRFTDDLFTQTAASIELRSNGISADLTKVKSSWDQKINEIFYLSDLSKPENTFQLTGGKNGKHSEHLGHLLADMQYLTNKYPEATW